MINIELTENELAVLQTLVANFNYKLDIPFVVELQNKLGIVK